MKKHPAIAALRYLFPAALAVLIYALGPFHADPAQPPSEEGMGPIATAALARMALPGTEDLQLIIQHNAPSLVEWIQATEGQGAAESSRIPGDRPRMQLQSAQALAYRDQLAGARRELVRNLGLLSGVQVQGSADTVMHAVIARVPVRQFNQVSRLPGVKRVYFSRPQHLLLDSSAALLNASGMWERAGGQAQAGRGIKIGIIDTGIDITNPMFIDNSLVPPPGYPKGEEAYVNSKVIVARNYIGLLANRQIVQSAQDEVGHGTFVAGAAAGRQVTAPLAAISGMAPGAFLGNYKVFGTPGINNSTTTAAVLAAIDAAVSDGMDILNLSLGGLDYLLPSDDAQVIALESAIRAGVVVVVSAGNKGPETYSINNPGGTPDAITVGAVTNSRTFATQIRVTAPAPVPSNLKNIIYIAGDNPSASARIAPAPMADVQTLDSSGLACFALPAGSLTKKIALIQRGSCPFATKVANAESAGAAAMVVYNNNPNEGLVRMANVTAAAIPAVMISNADGLALKEYITAHPGEVQAEMDSYETRSLMPATPRVIASFSSVGPAPDFSIKPDLVAIGAHVYSAAQKNNPNGLVYDPSGFTVGQGTSFSAPMVAGTAAVLKQLFPGFGPLAIKSLITTTASQNITAAGGAVPNILRTGSGLLDMGAAARAGAVITPEKLNFGTASYADSFSISRTFSIRNISPAADQFTLSVEPMISGPKFTLDPGITGTVPPEGTVNIKVTLQVASPLTGGFQGFILARSASSSITYRIPYWAGLYVPDPSRILAVSQNPSGGSGFTSLSAALKSARPGNIIEIADSGKYSAGLVIGTNDDGLPLNGITIRAASGQSPTLDGSGLSDKANITIVGLHNILLQGLNITGGSTGVLLLQPSLELPLSVTIDHCTISDVSEGSMPIGIEIRGGGTVEVTQSTIANSKGTGLFAREGTYLTVLNSTVRNNSNVGIAAQHSNVQVLNSTASNNIGPGLYCGSCAGTIDGSTFTANRGSYGDGAEISDGHITVTDNIFDSNERAGMGFFSETSSGPGPVVLFAGNVVRSNKIYGVIANPGQDLRIEGNLIKDNGSGVRLIGSTSALLVNNIVVRSNDPARGDGIQVAGFSKARLVNNTIQGNLLRGITLSAGASISVLNTIISSSRAGDILGINPGDIQYSLVSDRALPSGNNVTGDPKLVDPEKDVFDLSPGSPALDAGSNEAADLPFLDFNRGLRVAASIPGSPTAGQGTVDIGAIEANSAYPLTFPVLANGRQDAFQDDLATGVALLNYGGNAATATFTAFKPSGEMLEASGNPATRSFTPASQLPILASQLFGLDLRSPMLGAILALSSQRLAGFFLAFDADFSRYADGVVATDQAATNLLFMRHESDSAGKATYVLFNPGVRPANVAATLYSSAGASLGAAKTSAIAPKGQWIFEFDTGTSSSGYVQVRSDRPISGLQFFGNTQETSTLGATIPGSEARIFFPHIAANQGFTTQLGVINTNPAVVNIVLTAYDNDGQPLGTPAWIALPPRGQLLQSATDLFKIGPGALVTGYAIAECDRSAVQGFTAFRYDDRTNKSAAAVPADSVPHRRLLFSHVAHQVAAGSGGSYQTGVALLNPLGTRIGYTMRVFNGAGTLVAEKSDTLGPRQKISKILSHPAAGAGFFTQPLSLASGHIEVTTDYGLLGFELFFTEDLSQLASVPAQIVK